MSGLLRLARQLHLAPLPQRQSERRRGVCALLPCCGRAHTGRLRQERTRGVRRPDGIRDGCRRGGARFARRRLRVRLHRDIRRDDEWWRCRLRRARLAHRRIRHVRGRSGARFARARSLRHRRHREGRCRRMVRRRQFLRMVLFVQRGVGRFGVLRRASADVGVRVDRCGCARQPRLLHRECFGCGRSRSDMMDDGLGRWREWSGHRRLDHGCDGALRSRLIAARRDSPLGIHRRGGGLTFIRRGPVVQGQERVHIARQHGRHGLVAGLVSHDHPLRLVRLAVHEQQNTCAPHPAECHTLRTVHEHRGTRHHLPGVAPQLGLREQQSGERMMQQLGDGPGAAVAARSLDRDAREVPQPALDLGRCEAHGDAQQAQLDRGQFDPGGQDCTTRPSRNRPTVGRGWADLGHGAPSPGSAGRQDLPPPLKGAN